MKTTYLHNSRCSKSRQGLELVRNKNIDHEVVEYLKTPLTKAQLSDLFTLLNKKYSLSEFTRIKEREFDADVNSLTKKSWVELIHKTPKLMERPILFNKTKAIIGRPPEELLSF